VFNAEQNRIKKLCDDIGVRAEIMNGDVPSSKRGEIDRKFQNKEIDVIIGSPKIASIGFNWEFIKEIIFTSMSYDNSEFSQAMGRGDRGSRTRPLLVYILTYDTKVEKRIMTILYRKSDELKKIFSKSS
jgi:superfamily II DNA or RNA helicase